MKKKGWQGVSNPFIKPMKKSLPIAVSIVSYHLSRLLFHKDDSALQLAMYDEFKIHAEAFIDNFGGRLGDKITQVQLTKIFKSVFKDMATKLDDFDSLSRAVHRVNSKEYLLIWGRNRYRFYKGSYEDRKGALVALAKAMTAQGVPDGATAVMEYHAEIIDNHSKQQVRMAKVGTDTISVYELRKILIKKLNKNRGTLIHIFGDSDYCEDIVKRYFPINLMGNKNDPGHHQLIIPKADFRKICIHLFKSTEKIEILAEDADIWICLADNANHPITSGFLAKKGIKYVIYPNQLGDLTKKYVIATNASLTESSDLIFNIRKGK